MKKILAGDPYRRERKIYQRMLSSFQKEQA